MLLRMARGCCVLVGLLALAEELLVDAVEVGLALFSWQNTLTTFMPLIISSAKPLDLAERYLLPEEEARGLAADAAGEVEAMSSTPASTTRVSQRL